MGAVQGGPLGDFEEQRIESPWRGSTGLLTLKEKEWPVLDRKEATTMDGVCYQKTERGWLAKGSQRNI